MARNRKYQAAAVRFGPAVKAFLLCGFIATAGVGYVWQKQQINDLGKQILLREKKLAELREKSEKLRRQVATLQSPQFVEMRIRELNLGLVQPQAAQVWRLVEPSTESPSAALPVATAARTDFNRRQYAQQSNNQAMQ